MGEEADTQKMQSRTRYVTDVDSTLYSVLSPFQQSFGNLVLLYDIDMRTPARQSIAVDSIQQRLAYCLEKIFWFLKSGVDQQEPRGRACYGNGWRTRSGSHRPSQVPNSWSLAVPDTIKSLAKSMHPILSKPQMNGFPVV